MNIYKYLKKFKRANKYLSLKFFNDINENKIFIGLMMIFMNIGSRHIDLKLTPGQETLLKNFSREILIFTIAFMGTRNIFIALFLTGLFIILMNYVFNEECSFNLLPRQAKEIIALADKNNDGILSREEIDDAIKLLKKAKRENPNLDKEIKKL